MLFVWTRQRKTYSYNHYSHDDSCESIMLRCSYKKLLWILRTKYGVILGSVHTTRKVSKRENMPEEGAL